jgi:hypothetical protein
MLSYYVFTASRVPSGLIVFTVLLHIAAIVVMIILAYTDPGMIPKVLVPY